MFLKATQGTGFVDGTFAERWRQLATLGIPRGAYHFAEPVQDVVLYTGIPFWRERMGDPARLPAGCVGWLSRYNKAGPYAKPLGRPAAWPAGRPDIWQFTDGTSGRVRAIPGIGKVDCNEMTEACFQRLLRNPGWLPPAGSWTTRTT